MTVVAQAGASARAIQASFLASLDASERKTSPYRHWLLENVLPAETAETLFDLPIALPDGLVFHGRREDNNPTRVYFNPEARAKYPIARALAEAFQSPSIVAAIERECATDLKGANLRMEYCQDTAGFWLEPHTDIGVKRFTMSIFLCRGAGAAGLGTDIFDQKKNWVGSAPSDFNRAMLFIPGSDTYHGFRARQFPGVRKSIIINYVAPEWRSREELAYPETPVKPAG